MIGLLAQFNVQALRSGRWEVIAPAPSRNSQPYVLCRCDCGAEKEVALVSIRTGRSRSCGCLRREVGPSNKRHGLSDSKTYNVWLGMRQRCLNPNNPAYTNYGGRGITIAPAWDTFDQFLADMGEVPEGMTLERKDNDKGYGPDNCVWASRLEQGRNTRKCRQITHNGQTKTLAEWAHEYSINRQTLGKRLDTGWSMERALSTSPLAYHNREAATA
jgi:hypothetical protein